MGTPALDGGLIIGSESLTIEQLIDVSRHARGVSIAPSAVERIHKGRAALDRRMADGDRIYGVNTGVGGNIKFELEADQAVLLQHNIMRHLSCATGQPLPPDVVRGAMLLRIATFATGCSAVRVELVEAVRDLINAGVTPVVPRYGSLGASGDLMPSAYAARVLVGMGQADYEGQRLPSTEAMQRAGLPLITFAAKEGLALINGTTFMTAIAALLWHDARIVLRAMVAANALAVEAIQVPAVPFDSWVHEHKGHPGQIAVAEFMRAQLEGSGVPVDPAVQSCYSLRCTPQGLGPAWESLEDGRAVIEREMNSANDNPLIDPDTGKLYGAGNFYGGHISRLLDTWKIDMAIIGNWGNALMAVLVDDKFNRGLPANLVPNPGVNSGFKGMQLSVTSLTCAIRQMAGPSSIHSLPTEQYNQDVVSLGMHAAVTAMDALDCLRNETAMVLLAAVQAVDLRGGPGTLGRGNRRAYNLVREDAAFLDRDRPMEHEVFAVAARLAELSTSASVS